MLPLLCFFSFKIKTIKNKSTESTNFRFDNEHLKQSIQGITDLLTQAQQYRDLAQVRDTEKQAQIQAQIEQLEKLEREREEAIRIEEAKNQAEEQRRLEESQRLAAKRAIDGSLAGINSELMSIADSSASEMLSVPDNQNPYVDNSKINARDNLDVHKPLDSDSTNDENEAEVVQSTNSPKNSAKSDISDLDDLDKIFSD